MGFRVEITTAARQDILDGINYYQAISEKLCEAFCKDIFLSLMVIGKKGWIVFYCIKR